MSEAFDRAYACIDACKDIPNPAAIPEVIAAAKSIVADPMSWAKALSHSVWLRAALAKLEEESA